MENLVSMRGKQILCDSRIVADKFEKKHTHVAKIIRKLISDFKGDLESPLILKKNRFKGNPEIPLIFKKEGEYRGKKFTYYEMDKEFFSHLAMRFKGEKAFSWQRLFIRDFFRMEQALLRQGNLEWRREREQGKEIHLILTDEIKLFIDYAISQGSQNAKNYYSTITKMQYKALGLIEKNEKIDKEFRNTLDVMDLHILLSSEIIARKALMDGIDKKLHYKDIFQLAKQRVLQYAGLVLIKHTKEIINIK